SVSRTLCRSCCSRLCSAVSLCSRSFVRSASGSCRLLFFFFFSSRRRHTRSVSAFLLNRSSDLPLPPETELSRQMTTSTTSIDIMGLQAAYANLHTDQERDYFMQRYHDVISSFGGKTSYDADNRPLLVMRSNLWASGYDVD